MYVCMYVCPCVRMYVCVRTCTDLHDLRFFFDFCGFSGTSPCICMYVCPCVRMYVSVRICTDLRNFNVSFLIFTAFQAPLPVYVCMYVYVYVCVFTDLHDVCMCVFVRMCVYFIAFQYI